MPAHQNAQATSLTGSALQTLRHLESPFGTNEVRLCERADGTRCVLKVYRSPKSALTELRALQLGKAQGASAIMPLVIWAGHVARGRWAMECNFFPRTRYWDPSADRSEQGISALAATLRQLHRGAISASVRGWGGLASVSERSPTWWDFLIERLDRRGPLLVNAGLADGRKIVQAQMQLELLASASPQIMPSLVHGDLNAANILVGTDGKVVLIDFERAMIGHSTYDLPKLWFQALGKDPLAIERLLKLTSRSTEFETRAFALYLQLYAIDMAVYLLDHQNSDTDRRLLGELAIQIASFEPDNGRWRDV